MKYFAAILLAFALSGVGFAQTTAVTATITDSNGDTWNNGTWAATLSSPRGNPTISGVPLTGAQTSLHGSLSASGALAAVLTANTSLDQTGSSWSFQLCPNASFGCSVVPGIIITGANQVISTQLSAGVRAPLFSPGLSSYGYSDAEVNPSTLQLGATYYNVNTPCLRQYSNAGWTCAAGGGSSGVASFNGRTGAVTPANGDYNYTNLSGGGSPRSLVSGYPASVNHAFLMDECTPTTSGTVATVTDAIGGATATSSQPPYCSSDGAVSINGSYVGNRFSATSLTSGFTAIEVVFTPVQAGTTGYQAVAGYGGETAGSSTADMEFVGLAPSWTQNGTASTTPSTFLSYMLDYNGSNYNGYNGTTSVAPAGVIDALLISPAGGNRQIWINGQRATDDASPAELSATFNSGFLEFGGTVFGYRNLVTPFNGKIYTVLTHSTVPTQQQIQQTYSNNLRILALKGALANQYATSNAGQGAQGSAGKAVQVVAYGESITWGHGLTNSSYAYGPVATTTINGGNAYGMPYGVDSTTGYVMDRSIQNVLAQFSPVATNVAVLFSNANDCKGNSLTFGSNVATQAAAALVKDARLIQAAGGLAILASGTSGNFGSGDTGKDACNPVLRQAAKAAGLHFWDIASDPRVGADGAYNAGATGCSGGAVYQGDQIHPTQCMQAYMGANLAAKVNDILFSAPVSTTAATYAMTGKESPLSTNPSTNSQTVTLPECIGLDSLDTLTINNTQTSGANTVTVVPLTSTYSGETINGATSFVLGNATAVRFTPFNRGDTTAGCYWAASK